DLSVGRQEKSLASSFHSMTGERNQQQPIFGNGGVEIRQTPQNVDASRLTLNRLIGRKQDYLIFWEARITHQRVGDHPGIVVGTLERADLRIEILVHS